jgi:uncharacterized protein DUF6986
VFSEHVSTSTDLADVTGLAPRLAAEVLDRVRAKLASEPIEDLRIDFEDGYGSRPDDQEDTHVVAAANALASSVADGSAPPYHGIRFKSFERPTRRRGLRTLALLSASWPPRMRSPMGSWSHCRRSPLSCRWRRWSPPASGSRQRTV